jgi:hypothetical protein
LSGGVRYIYSDLVDGFGSNDAKVGQAFAIDLSTFYTNKFSKKSTINWGLNLSNMGTKMYYSSSSIKDYLPANFRTGVSFIYESNRIHRIAFNAEVEKLMVSSLDPSTP